MDSPCPTIGLHEALTYLDSLRAADTDPLADIPEDDGRDDTALADQQDTKSPLRHSPDELLNALAIMRLCFAAEQAGPDLMSPGPGLLSVLVVSSAKDRDRVARRHPDLWRGMSVDLPALVIEDTQGRSAAVKDLHNRIEARLMSGSGVFAILTGTTPLPSELEALVTARTTLPPMTARMLAVILEYLHPGRVVEVPITDQQLGKLSPVALAPVLAAETLDAALIHLQRLGGITQSPSDGPSLDDVFGQPEAVDALRQVVSDLDAWRAGELPWCEVTKSFLLVGPPGTGKTMLAEALARSAGIVLVKTSYADVQKAGHQGDALKALNEAAERAKTGRPAAFFLDEIDSFYNRSQSSNGYIIGMVNGLLTLVDSLSATEGVVLIAATNDPDRVDPAVVRAGRFDRHIRVGRPIRSGITAMLSAAVAGMIPEPDLDRVSEQLVGLSGAEVAALLREARTGARKAGRDLALADLQAAADRVQPQLGDALMRRVAVHEAAHVIAGHAIGLPAATLARISPRGGEVIRPHLNAMTERDIRGMTAAVLAGRAAEDIIFGDVTSGGGTGSSSDLAQATSLGIRAECAFGFGPSLSWISPDTPPTLLPAPVRDRVEDRLRAAQEEARRIISRHRDTVERIADALLEHRELDGAALAGLLEGVDVQADGAAQPAGGHDA
jgi:AAA+ superfamily predicted ATPase